MERKKASDFDPQLLSLFTDTSMAVLTAGSFWMARPKFAIGGLTATALWDMLLYPLPTPISLTIPA